MKILVAYDGTLHSQRALRYGINKSTNEHDELVVLLVFNPNLFIAYEAGPKAMDVARREFLQYTEDAENIVRELGSKDRVRIVTLEGDPETELIKLASSADMDLVLAPPRYKALLKTSPAPVQVIPGVILVPVDNTDSAFLNLDKIAAEAISTGSSIVLLGVVPVHLYNSSEKATLDKTRKDTAVSVRNLKRALEERGIKTAWELRFGYPDEEIIKGAEEHAASLIILPSGGTSPSELSKAAAIILDEPERLRWPLFIVPAEGAA